MILGRQPLCDLGSPVLMWYWVESSLCDLGSLIPRVILGRQFLPKLATDWKDSSCAIDATHEFVLYMYPILF